MSEKNNFLEHKDLVRAIDGILSNNQEWDWFAETIEEKFDMSDIKNWQEYLRRQNTLAQVYRLLIRVRRKFIREN